MTLDVHTVLLASPEKEGTIRATVLSLQRVGSDTVLTATANHAGWVLNVLKDRPLACVNRPPREKTRHLRSHSTALSCPLTKQITGGPWPEGGRGWRFCPETEAGPTKKERRQVNLVWEVVSPWESCSSMGREPQTKVLLKKPQVLGKCSNSVVLQ